MLLDEADVMPPPVDPPDDGDGRGDNDSEPVRWTTVQTFNDPPSAHIARLRLEADGIPCFIADENIAATAWHYAIATGGLKLQVPSEDADRATAALRRDQLKVAEAADDNLQACPRCGSAELE